MRPAAHHHSAQAPLPIRRWRWLAGALVIGATAGTALGLVHGGHPAATPSAPPSRANVTWPAGARPAPDFRLADERGGPISLRRFHGRPVLLTFIDPACTTLCPLEARVLEQAAARTARGQRPAIVAVSVNPWGQTQAFFRRDAHKWRLGPAWHWAVGRYGQLAPVWKRYEIAVLVRRRVVDGHAIHDVSHTEASILIDGDGYERAIFAYPFRAEDVTSALRQLRDA